MTTCVYTKPLYCSERHHFVMIQAYFYYRVHILCHSCCFSVPANNPPPRVGGRWVCYVCIIYELTGSRSRQLSFKIMILYFLHYRNTRPACTKPQVSLSHKWMAGCRSRGHPSFCRLDAKWYSLRQEGSCWARGGTRRSRLLSGMTGL